MSRPPLTIEALRAIKLDHLRAMPRDELEALLLQAIEGVRERAAAAKQAESGVVASPVLRD
jgi:hypothetical protein